MKKVISMTLIFDFDMHIFLGLGDSAVFHCMLCLFVSESYWKTQVSSPVMICLRIFRLSSFFSSMSLQNLTWFCFWSSNKILGTILAHTFCITRSCSKIICTDFLFRLSSSDIIHTSHQLLYCCDVFICPRCGRLSRIGITLHVLVAFLKMFVLFEDLCPRYHIFIINLFKKFKTLSWGFLTFTKKFKLIRYSILELLTVS